MCWRATTADERVERVACMMRNGGKFESCTEVCKIILNCIRCVIVSQ